MKIRFRVTGRFCREFTGHRWRGALKFTLICAWINKGEAGDLRRYRALWRHYSGPLQTLSVHFNIFHNSSGNLFKATPLHIIIRYRTVKPISAWKRSTSYSWINAIYLTQRWQWHRLLYTSFDVYFDLRLKKQGWGWWLETLSRSLWRHCSGPLQMLSVHFSIFHNSSGNLFKATPLHIIIRYRTVQPISACIKIYFI